MLNSDFRDILSEFTTAKVEFLVVGAFALAAHGIVRGTGDIDLWVRPTAENAERVAQALRRFGAPPESADPANFSQRGKIVQLGVVPIRIDVMTDISGVSWDDAWPHRLGSSLGGVAVSVLGRAQLIANKRATKRPKDELDVRSLER